MESMRLARRGLFRDPNPICRPALGILFALALVLSLAAVPGKDLLGMHEQTAADPSRKSDKPLPESSRDRAENPRQGILIKNVVILANENYTRVSIICDGSPRYLKGELHNPERVFFDFPNARLDLGILNKTIAFSDKHIQQARAAQNRADLVRVVLDLNGTGEVLASDRADAFGIIVDLRFKGTDPPIVIPAAKVNPAPALRAVVPPPVAPNPAPSAAKAAVATPSKPNPNSVSPPAASSVAAKTQPEQKQAAPGVTASKESAGIKLTPAPAKEANKAGPAVVPAAPVSLPRIAEPTSHGDRTLTRMLGLKIGRIVLDPGHGGQDKGTIGPGGLLEKDLVLEVSKELQKLLREKLGAYVVLTRSDDSFISLEERTAIANQQQADLFLSIHANSSAAKRVSGVETYFLDFARTDSAREVAARENATSDLNIRDLQELVLKITQADKLQESREFATTIQKSLFGGARSIIPATADRGVRSAPFVVLIGARMPSVLVEIAFISNPSDEKLLLKEANRRSFAKALFQGIEGYMKSLGSAAARNHQ
jgi:N-acetylmuramoyl-L-alanine amidase